MKIHNVIEERNIENIVEKKEDKNNKKFTDGIVERDKWSKLIVTENLL